MAGRHRASKVVVAPPVVGHPARDDSVLMGVFIMATKATVRRIAYFASSNLLCCPVGLLVAMALQLHIRVH